MMQDVNESSDRQLVREEQILETAKKLFAAKGFEGVSMRDLASAVGITPGALYHYFPTKHSLQVATLEWAHTSTPATAMQMLDNDELSDEEKLHRFVLRLCERFYNDREFHILLERAFLESQEGEIHNVMIESVLKKNFGGLEKFLGRINPAFDAHMFANFVYCLVAHTYKTLNARKMLDSYKPEYAEPAFVADQIMRLLKGQALPSGSAEKKGK